MGFTSIAVQVFLLREFLIAFQGNELSIGIILANWLLLEAIGSYLIGRLADRASSPEEGFSFFQILVALSFPLAIYLVRVLRSIIGLQPGEGAGIFPIFYSSFLILAPLGLSDGAQFTFGCRLYNLLTGKAAYSAGRVYVYEALGTMVGGLMATYIAIPHFLSLEVAFGLSVLNLFSAILLLTTYAFGRVNTERRKIFTPKRFSLLSFSTVLFLGAIYFLVTPQVGNIHWNSLQKYWRNQDLLYSENSIYGNVTVTRTKEQYNFFYDGIPLMSTPTPDISFVEEFVHLPLLFHPFPRDILLISGGMGGILSEILKHPVVKIDYAELDPLIINVVKNFSTPLTDQELKDLRVVINYRDGRLHVNRTPHQYDLVLVNLPPPSSLQLNRLYTEDFLVQVKNILRREGILVLRLPGSLTYLSRELRNLNGCIFFTLKNVFPAVRIVPGDFHLFLASDSSDILNLPVSELVERWKQRSVETRLINPFYLQYKLDEAKESWLFHQIMKAKQIKINQDLTPSGVFYDLSLWNALFSPGWQRYFQLLERINLWMLIIPLGMLVIIFLVLGKKIAPGGKTILLVVGATGFSGMAFNMLFILTFQSFYGYVYYWVGLLITAFMMGLTAGSLFMTWQLTRKDVRRNYFLKLELGLIIFSFFLLGLFKFPTLFLRLSGGQYFFLFLELLAGILVGLEFPLANKICVGEESSGASRVAGMLYASDLIGAWMGSLLVSIIFLPLLGIVSTCLIVAAIKIFSLSVLLAK